MIVVPRDFVLIEKGPLTLVLRRDCCEQLLGCGIDDPERLCARQTGVMHIGRGSMPAIELEPGMHERVLVRKYRRGGLLRFFLPDVFFSQSRAFDELAVTLAAAQSGIPVADVVAAVSLRTAGILRRHYLVTRELRDCCDLPAWFQGGCTDEEVETRTRLLADLIRRMHDSGLYHADLNLKNILVGREDARRLFIIDWDKSTHAQGPLGQDARQRNVIRLCRSAAKLRLRGIPVPAEFPDIFFEQYWQNSEDADACRRALRRVLRGREFFWRYIR